MIAHVKKQYRMVKKNRQRKRLKFEASDLNYKALLVARSFDDVQTSRCL